MAHPQRYDRLHRDRPPDQRTAGQRDRDRILYTSAFRRLAGITQVAGAGEKYVFHNRLTHTLEVAQIARRLSEYLVKDQGARMASRVGGVDPDVVEAAALAHDLGHPPFGHIAEQELDELVRKANVLDGFEGNAQTFRVVTKLALRQAEAPGLNLTRATLNAVLKYPWLRGTGGGKRGRKWGAYHTEEKEFKWARELFSGEDTKSAEAELMDWADDIAYSVHDIEDFYRAKLIPLDRLIYGEPERTRFLEGTFDRWQREGNAPPFPQEDLQRAFIEIMDFMAIFPGLTDAYSGTSDQRAGLRSLTAQLIARYLLNGIRLREPTPSNKCRVEIDPQYQMEITILKELTWHYVIKNPGLATQEYGQRRVVRELFQIFHEAAAAEKWAIFPARYRENLALVKGAADQARIVADLIASLSEQQALEIHQRLTGISPGSVLDSIIR